MKRIFDDDLLEEMLSLWESGIYTKTALANRYNCSLTTICLWLSPEETRANKLKSRINRVKCDCGVSYQHHERCSLCKIHTHSKEITDSLPNCYKFGLKTIHKHLCNDCYTEHKNDFIQLRGYYKLGPSIKEYVIVMNPYTKEIL